MSNPQKIIEDYEQIVKSTNITKYKEIEPLIEAYYNKADGGENSKACYQRVIELLEMVEEDGKNKFNWNMDMVLALHNLHIEELAIIYLERMIAFFEEHEDFPEVENILSNLKELLAECYASKDSFEEAELAYYEKRSYMFAVLRKEQEVLLDKKYIVERIKKLPIKVFQRENPAKEEAEFSIEYDGSTYEVDIYPSKMMKEYKGSGVNRRQYFSDEEKFEIDRSEFMIAVVVTFNQGEHYKSLYFQLKLLVAVADDDLLAVVDESGEQIFSGKYIMLAAKSNVMPPPSMLYNIQAVSNSINDNPEDDEVWLHTHGLARCHLPELEILNSNRKYVHCHCNLLNVVASRLLETGANIEVTAPICTAYLSDDRYLVTTIVPWTEVIKDYSPKMLGGIEDRINGHNTFSCVIFVYPDKLAYDNDECHDINIYNDLLADDPMYFLSVEETNRMRELALERVNFMRNIGEKHPEYVHLKLGLNIDKGKKRGVQKQNEKEYLLFVLQRLQNEKEHLWFVLQRFIDENKIEAKLMNEPYYIKNLHEGDIAVYTISQITDWEIITPEYRIKPDDIYLLSK